MRRLLLLIALLSSISLTAQLKSPSEYLVTDYGEHFTPHHLLVEYTQYLADNSPYMTVERYGYTNERRPLLFVTFATPDNHTDLENIRQTNLYNAGIADAPASSIEKSILWMSFGVHGNEVAGPESSMEVMHKLADPDAETQAWLNNTIVLIDPSVNPDGYSRYSHWIWREAGKKIHPEHTDREHMEPWPGGRTNHYHFDLNRDWAWQTQIESQQRMVKYNQWLPHVHVDFHEMGPNEHYYFAPAAKPYHEYITQWQKDFQVTIGRNNAKYFDREGWLYFTREVFDLLYPSYGDTYPTFNGAIGMTYEQGGSGRAGRAIKLDNGDILTIRDRIDHHRTTAMATFETVSKNSSDVISNFKQYFRDAVQSPKGKFRAYVIKASESQKAIADLLERNYIKFDYAHGSGKGSGYHYQSSGNKSFSIDRGDIIIDVVQPKSTLIQVLMEPEPMLEDSLTYDITSWCLPFAYGVETYGLSSVPSVEKGSKIVQSYSVDCKEDAYAYYFEWGSYESHKLIARLMEKGIKLRVSGKGSTIEGVQLKRSYLVATRGDNKHIDDFRNVMMEQFSGLTMDYGCVNSGFSDTGTDLAGNSFNLLENPRVITISGQGVGTNAFGQIWHYFDNHLEYPLSIVDVNNFSRVDLDEYDVLILPDGYYSLSSHMESISSWVREGGKVIAIGSALRQMANKEGYALKTYAEDSGESADKKSRTQMDLRERLETYEGSERRSIRNYVPGAIVRNKVDQSHPLGYGLGEYYYSLKTGSSTYQWLTDAWNVVYVPDDVESYGFIGSELKKKIGGTVSFAVDDLGRGTIVYMVDNPLYRGFWHNGLHLFTNALFLVD